MKNSIIVAFVFLLALVSCKDGTPPSFENFSINGVPLTEFVDASFPTTDPYYFGNINDTVIIDMKVTDDDELFSLNVFIDTTDTDDKESLYSESLTGNEDFARMVYRMKAIDSLSSKYFFNAPLPVMFTLIDNNQNRDTKLVYFKAN